MNKKDRIAVVVTVIYMVCVLLLAGVNGELTVIPVFGIPALVYWGVRFIKGNISFIGSTN